MATRRLLNVDVSFISLVSKGANKKTLIWKSADNSTPTITKSLEIKKLDEDQHKVYCIVYSPDETDAQGDTASKETIEKMAYGFMKSKNIQNVDQQHDFKADEGYVAESWLLKAGDPIFPLEKEGAWAVCIKVENEETWDKIKKGEITGLSMAGIAEVEEVTNDTTVSKSQVNKSGASIMKTLAEIKKFVSDIFTKKSEETVTIQKDFNGELQNAEINEYLWRLERAVNAIYDDDSIEDKKAAVIESFNQCLAKIALVKSAAVEKAGKEISAKNKEILKAIKECHKTMGGHLDSFSTDEEPEGEPVQKSDNSNNSINNSSESEMKPEEIQKAISDGIAAAIKPLNDTITKQNEAIEKQNTTIADLQKSLNERVEKIEKAAPGSQQGIPDGGGSSSGTPKRGMFI